MAITADDWIEEHSRLGLKVEELREQQRVTAKMVNRMRLEDRPVFPTASMLAGIDAALDRIARDVISKSHHGDPALKGSGVLVAHTAGRSRLSIEHGSPLVFAGTGGWLWRFADTEVEALLGHITQYGAWTVTSWWTHDTGVSVVVAPSQGGA